MDIRYRLEGLAFEWNDRKGQSNFLKHGVTFEEAAEVFLDPFLVVGDASANDEDREFVLGWGIHLPSACCWLSILSEVSELE